MIGGFRDRSRPFLECLVCQRVARRMLKQKIWRRESRTFGKHYRRDDGIRYADTIRMLDMRETPTIECLSGHQLPLNPFVSTCRQIAHLHRQEVEIDFRLLGGRSIGSERRAPCLFVEQIPSEPVTLWWVS